MSEPTPAPPEPTPVPTPAPPPPAPEPAPSPKSVPSPALTEALIDGLDGEAAEFAKRFASKKDLVAAALDLRKKNSAMVNVPKEDSKPEQIAAFRKAIGAPESAEGYTFKDREGEQPSDADKALRASVAGILNKYHAPAGMALELQEAVQTLAEAQFDEQDRVARKFREDAEAVNRKRYGADYDGNKEVATRAVKALGDDAFQALMATPVSALAEKGNDYLLGDHPALLHFLATYGRREMPRLGPLTEAEGKSIKQQIDDIYREHPPGSAGYARRDIQERLQALFEQQEGAQPIVGSQGRAA